MRVCVPTVIYISVHSKMDLRLLRAEHRAEWGCAGRWVGMGRLNEDGYLMDFLCTHIQLSWCLL